MSKFVAEIQLVLKNSLSVQANNAKNAFAGIKKSLESINNGSGLMQLARDISVATSLTEPFRTQLSESLAEPARLAAKLDSIFTNIKTVTGKTKEEMLSFQKQVLAVGGRSTQGLEKTASAMYDIVGGVQDATLHIPMLEAAISLAEAGQADLTASTKGLISVMNAYKFPAEKASFVSDVFTRSVSLGVGTMDEFVSSISPIAGLTSSAGITFEELGTSIAFMTTQGVSASMSATRLQAAIVALMKPNKTMEEAIRKTGYASGSAMLKELGLAGSLQVLSIALGNSQDKMAEALGSTEALQGAIALTNSTFTDFSKTYMEGLNGITKASQKTQLESYEAKIARLNSAKEIFKQKVGSASNAINSFGISIQLGVINTLNKLNDNKLLSWIPSLLGGGMTVTNSLLSIGGAGLNTVAQIVTIMAMTDKAGGVLSLFGNIAKLTITPFVGLKSVLLTVIPVIWSFTTSLLACPLTWIILGIVALGGAAFLIIKNWGKISSFFKGLWNNITTLFKKGFDFIWNGLLNNRAIQTALAVFMPVIGIPILLIKNWEQVKIFFSKLPDFFKTIATSIWNAFVSGFGKAWSFFEKLLGLSSNKIPQTLSKGVEKNKNLFKNSLNNTFKTTESLLPHSDAKEGVFSTLTKSGGSIITTLVNGINSEEHLLKDTLNTSFENSFTTIDKKITNKTNNSKIVNINIHVDHLVKTIEDIKKTQDFLKILGELCGEAL